MAGEIPFLIILTVLCGHIGIVRTQGCDWWQHFCPSTGSCVDGSEACDGQCGLNHRFCLSTGKCVHESEACDGQCGEEYRLCPSTKSCLKNWEACDDQCLLSYIFCPSTNLCLHESEVCCEIPSLYCPSTKLCINGTEACDAQCGEHLGGECLTIGGPAAGSPCVFPFRFRGSIHFSCTTDGNAPDDTAPWCSTKVDKEGNHMGSQGLYGHCPQNCGLHAVLQFMWLLMKLS